MRSRRSTILHRKSTVVGLVTKGHWMSNRKDPAQRTVDRQLSGWSGRRVLSWSLMGLAVVVAATHLLAHAGWRPVPLGMGKQDLLLGYPMAAVLGLIGLLALDPKPRL